jgi:hypothetical protein
LRPDRFPLDNNNNKSILRGEGNKGGNMKKFKIKREFQEGVPGKDPLVPLKGFAAYQEIEKLANRVFSGKDVSVQAAIFGDEFNILIDGKEVLNGNTQDVREKLNAALELLDKEVSK